MEGVVICSIVRPGIFMECFDGFMGWIAVTVFREGLTKDATLPLVVSFFTFVLS